MVRSTKGQIQIGETVAVVFIFIILVVFGIVWFVQYSGNAEIDKQDELENLQLLEIIKIVMNMPELQCSIAGKTDATCLDIERIRALQDFVVSSDELARPYRTQFFGYELSVTPFYPVDLPSGFVSGETYQIFSFPVPDATESVSRPVPVVLFDPVSERKFFAMLVITQWRAS